MQRIKADMNRVSNQRPHDVGVMESLSGHLRDKKNPAMCGLGEGIIWDGRNGWCRGPGQECARPVTEEGESTRNLVGEEMRWRGGQMVRDLIIWNIILNAMDERSKEDFKQRSDMD